MHVVNMSGGAVLVGLAAFGLLVGSFLNVVIHRLPIMIAAHFPEESTAGPEGRFDLAWPPSHCPRCGSQIRMADNVPLIGYLRLGGRCRACRHPISLRYPSVELLGALAAVAMGLRFSDPVGVAAGAVFLWICIAILFIDVDTLLVPDALTGPLLWLGLLVAAVTHRFIGPGEAVVGAATGWLLFRGVASIGARVTGRPALGGGDVKLLAALGAWVGVAGLPQVVLIACLSGTLTATVLMVCGKLKRADPFPFGPFLAAAGVFTLVAGNIAIFGTV